MKVMVIVKASRDSEAGEMPSTELLAAMGQFNEELANAGMILAAEGLHPSSKGARVHFSGKNRIVTDGPFAETKELIAGFWLWKVKSMQEAIDWVKKCPNPMKVDSDVEIRPVFAAEDFGAEFTPELREQEAAVRAKSLGLGALSFKDAAELHIAGLSRHYTSETRIRIPNQWEEFMKRIKTVPRLTDGTSYGVCWNSSADCSFDYLTGREIPADVESPADLQTLTIPARRYAVFAHAGHVSAIPKTIDLIWTKWAPECGLKIAHAAPCFERYSSDFDPQTGLGGMEVWIPLES